MPASATKHRHDEEVNAVYGPAANNDIDVEVPAYDVVVSPALIKLTVKCVYCGYYGHLTQVLDARLVENAT